MRNKMFFELLKGINKEFFIKFRIIRFSPCANFSHFSNFSQILLFPHDSTFLSYRDNADTTYIKTYRLSRSLNLFVLHPSVKIMDTLIRFPQPSPVLFGKVCIGMRSTVAKFFFSVLAINMKGGVLSLPDEVRLYDGFHLLPRLLLLLLEEIFQHS